MRAHIEDWEQGRSLRVTIESPAELDAVSEKNEWNICAACQEQLPRITITIALPRTHAIVEETVNLPHECRPYPPPAGRPPG